jgi:transcriptional regulator with XRE-family HTH domain
MTPKPTLDFTRVEALRKHMLLTTSDMAELLGVSRMTYYGWVRGKALRKSNDESVRTMLRKLLDVMTRHNWPTPEVIASDQKQRKERLIAVLNSDN